MKIINFKKIMPWILICILVIGSMTGAQAKTIEEEIDEQVARILMEAKVPGLAIAVTTADEVLFSKGYGVTFAGGGVPMTENTVSGIGSITKSFTALAMLQEVEKGHLDLGDLVIEYLPDFKTFDPSLSNRITIGMLLNNSSGLPHNVDFTIWEKNDGSTDYEKMLKQYENVVLAFEPGTSYSYSNEGFMLAGLILEKVVGKKYEEIIADNILNPLGMNHSTADITQVNALGGLYGNLPGVAGFLPANETHLGIMVPAGSEFRSSVMDLSHYAQMMLSGGAYQGLKILDPATYQQYESEGVVPFEGYGFDLTYGAGWMHINDTSYVLHGGQTMAMSAMLLLDLDAKIGVTVLYNVADVADKQYSAFDLAFRILELYNGKDLSNYHIVTEPVISENTQFMTDDLGILGDYQSTTGLIRLSVVNEGGLLSRMVSDQGTSELRLKMLSDTKIYTRSVASEGLMQVIRGSNNEVVALVHPMYGQLDRVQREQLTGYTTYNGAGVSFSVCEKMTQTSTSQGEGVKLVDGEVQLDFMITDWSEELFTLPEGLEILDQTLIRESVIGGKNCSEQILVFQEGNSLMALVRIGIQGKEKYTITGKMPFEKLTEIRSEQLLTLVGSMIER